MFQFAFMRRALIAIVLLTPLLSLLGTMAVNRKMAFFSDALGHSALAGVGIGVLLGVGDVTVSMLIFGVFWALMISRINQSGRTGADTIISVFSSTGIALGLLILSRSGNFARYNSLLVGDILHIAPRDLYLMGAALAVGAVLWGAAYNRLLLTAVSVPLARSRGVNAAASEYLFVCMVAVAVMLSIRWVGVLLINALLILPAAAGRNLSRSARQHALWSVGIGLASGVGGLCLAYRWDTGVGAAVVLCAAACYFASLIPGLVERLRA